MPSRRALLSGLGGLAAVSVLSACGTTDPATNSTSAASAPSGGASPSGPITVTDASGTKVTLDKPATRVVSLEWGQTEDLIALGVQPVGVADIKGYRSWDTAAAISGNPVDVGTRGEPSLEAVAKAAPDLIVGIDSSIPGNVLEQMKKIAPVVVLKGADATRPLELMKQNHLTVATLVGKQTEAAKVLGDLEASIAAAKAKLEPVKPKVIFSYIYSTGNTVELRMHSDRSQPMALAKQIGVINAFNEPGDDDWGLGTYDLEKVAKLPADTQILYWANKDTPDPVTGVLASNSVWKALPAVKNAKVFPVAEGVWIYGGPSSAKQWIDELVKVLNR